MLKNYSFCIMLSILLLACTEKNNDPNDFELILDDAHLIGVFENNEAQLEDLVESLSEHRDIVRIANDFIDVVDMGVFYKEQSQDYLSQKEWDEYLAKFNEIGISEGFLRNNSVYSDLLFIIHSVGSVTGGELTGLAYSSTPIRDHISSLDDFKTKAKAGIVYKKINKNWYLFLKWGG